MSRKSKKSAKSQQASKTPPPPAADPAREPWNGQRKEAATSAQTQQKALSQAAREQKSQFAHVFSNAIAVMMRDRNYRELRLKDLETLLVPAVVNGQCAVAQARMTKDGPLMPVAVALWASVSPAIDKKMSADLATPPGLRPTDWRSGDHVWVVALAGETKALPGFLKQLLDKDLKGRTVKMRVSDKDGTRRVEVLSGGDKA